MTSDIFDHLFVEPGSFDATVSFYRDVVRDPDGNLIAYEQAQSEE